MSFKNNLLLLIMISCQCFAQNAPFPKVLTMQEQAEVLDTWLEERVKTVLPEVMRRSDIDMWIIIGREYNEDPVLKTLLPSTWLSARRTTILIAYDSGEGKPIETFGFNRYNTGNVFKTEWDKDVEPNQWEALADMIASKDPKKIGINKSKTFALADGLSATEYDQLMQVLPEKYQSRLVSAENIAVGWLETRTESEMIVYRNIMQMAHQIIAEGFSEKVIQPGVTTTDDVVWWYRNRIRELGFTAWFHPTVSIQNANPDQDPFNPLGNPGQQRISPGDLVHVDFGITYLNLNTDTQQHLYVLKSNEKTAPDYLQKAFKVGNRVQDILTSNFKTGATGNEVLKATLNQCKTEGIDGVIYSHPIGYHGHGAGPMIGMWDKQDGVPGVGDYPIYKNTAYSIELSAGVYIEEWKKEIRIMVEEDAFFDGEKVSYIDGRQTELFTLPRSLAPND